MLADHVRLRGEDKCLFLYEYTSGKNYSFSSTNGLISNLKKKPGSSANELYYKNKAIRDAATAFRQALNPAWLAEATLVPVPGSKAVGHPQYDDRIEQLCRSIAAGVDVRNLVAQRESAIAAHEAGAGSRVTVDELLGLYDVNEALAAVPIRQIGIVDDVLTAGTHFRAMKAVLSARFPALPITGLFIARRVFVAAPEGL